MAREAAKPTVCVTGASGGIGQALLAQLAGAFHVKALFRVVSPTSRAWQQRWCEVVLGDLAAEAALAELTRGCRYVFHCAALVDQASYEQAHAVNVEGTRRLARAAAAHGCERFVHLSSVAVYTAAPPGAANVEETALSARDDMAVYSLTKLQSEEALKEVAQQHGLRYTILRPTSVYGPETRPHTLVPVALMQKGIPVILGEGTGLLDVVYVDDVARAMVLAALSAAAEGGTFNIGHESVTANEFFAHYSRMLNRPARHLPVKIVSALAAATRLIPGARRRHFDEVRRGARLLVDMSRNTRLYPSAKAAAAFGYAPDVSLRTGMLKTELWLKQTSRIPVADHVLDDYGALPFRPLAVAQPTSEAEIVQVVRIAASHGVRLRAIGSLHSPCGITHTDGICILLDSYTGKVKVEGRLVTVQAGMRLRELNEWLATLGLALPTNGSITAQTVAGAISTATHGGSIFHASLSDYVEAVRIVKADGSAVALDGSEGLLQAAIVSLGLLGIISTVTFRCVDAFTLQARSSVRPAPEVLADFDAMTRRSLHTSMFYFPITDQIEILSTDRMKEGDAAFGTDSQAATAAGGRRLAATAGGRRIARLALRSFAWLLRRHQSIQRSVTRRTVGSAYPVRSGRSDGVLSVLDSGQTGRSPSLIQDMELAVPYEQAPAAILALRAHFAATHRYPLIPIHIRCAARSELWLNPAYHRDVCWLEFYTYDQADRLFDEVHEVLAPFGYRFHWGKETRADREYARQHYEKWDDFVRLRDAWDPGGMFLNPYLEPFFGAAASPDRSELASLQGAGEK